MVGNQTVLRPRSAVSASADASRTRASQDSQPRDKETEELRKKERRDEVKARREADKMVRYEAPAVGSATRLPDPPMSKAEKREATRRRRSEPQESEVIIQCLNCGIYRKMANRDEEYWKREHKLMCSASKKEGGMQQGQHAAAGDKEKRSMKGK